jgi:hypothetical protein
MTLLEVVAGLALLASLLGALVMAKARYVRQAAAADRRVEAVAAADELLAGWHQNPRSLPRELSGSGAVSGDRRLAWRLRPVANAGVEELGGRVVRLEVLDERLAPPPVLVAVETVVGEPAQSPTTASTKPAGGRGAKGKTRTDAKGVHHP